MAEHEALRAAVARGDTEPLRIYFDTNPLNGQCSPEANDLMCAACELNKPEIIQLLINLGVDINSSSQVGFYAFNLGKSYLNRSIDSHAFECVQLLLDSGTEIGDIEDGLLNAAAQGNCDIVQLLLERGASLNHCYNTTGESALHLSCYNDHLQMSLFLIQQGIDANISDTYGKTALQWCRNMAHREMIEVNCEC